MATVEEEFRPRLRKRRGWWPPVVLDPDFDQLNWTFDLIDGLRDGRSLQSLSWGQATTSVVASDREISWKQAENWSQHAVRTGAAYLSDRQNEHRAWRRAALEEAFEAAQAEAAENNRIATARREEQRQERAKVQKEWMNQQQFVADRLRIRNHTWERETILASRSFECKTCLVVANVEPVNARFEVICPNCRHSIMADHDQMLKWIRSRTVT